MRKIQKFYGGGVALGLDLAPYSFSAPAITSTISSAASTAAPYLATAGQVALPLLAAPAAIGLGLYTLGNAKHGAVSGTMQAAIERERQRHLAEAEAEWQKKNQHYANLISTQGPIQYPVGTFYDYDSSTGTAYIERDLGNGLVGRWTQNMRTREQGNPVVYNSATGEAYEGIMNGPHSAYIPISLSNGKVVALPTDINDYRIFDEAAEGTENQSGTETPETPATPATPAAQTAVTGGGRNNNNNDDDDDDESDFQRNFKRGRQAGNKNKPLGYQLGKAVGWAESHPILTIAGGTGLYFGGKWVKDMFNNMRPKSEQKAAVTSGVEFDTSALDGTSAQGSNGNVGTIQYNFEDIPADTTSTYTVYLP